MESLRSTVLGTVATVSGAFAVVRLRRDWRRGWRPAWPGTGEPRLRPLDPVVRRWVEGIAGQVDPAAIRATVESMPGPRNRFRAPEAMWRTEEAILWALADAGWAAERRAYTFDDVPPGGFDGNPRIPGYAHLEGANILAVREGEASRDAVVVFAHYDTVDGSPGADDNGAGVAALLALARVLGPYRFRDTVILAATDMEEIGLFGGYALVRDLSSDRTILGAIDLEAIAYTSTAPGSQVSPPGVDLLFPSQTGRLRARGSRGDFTAVLYRESGIPLAARFAEGLSHLIGRERVVLLRDPKDLPYVGDLIRRRVPGARNFSRSDHVPFWDAGIPAIQVSDTAPFRYPDYHEPTDTPEKLDYERAAAIVAATAGAVARTAGLLGLRPGRA